MNAIYPGSFDPITNGHLDIIRRASNLYDKLYIGVSSDHTSKERLFSVDKRIQMTVDVTKEINNIEVIQFNGLLVDLCVELKCLIV